MTNALMKFRPHRGSLAEAMKELVELEPTKEALEAHLAKTAFGFEGDSIVVQAYGGPDTRIGWDAIFIVVGKRGVYGFCNQALTEKE